MFPFKAITVCVCEYMRWCSFLFIQSMGSLNFTVKDRTCRHVVTFNTHLHIIDFFPFFFFSLSVHNFFWFDFHVCLCMCVLSTRVHIESSRFAIFLLLFYPCVTICQQWFHCCVGESAQTRVFISYPPFWANCFREHFFFRLPRLNGFSHSWIFCLFVLIRNGEGVKMVRICMRHRFDPLRPDLSDCVCVCLHMQRSPSFECIFVAF